VFRLLLTTLGLGLLLARPAAVVAQPAAGFVLTPEEKAWIAAHPVIRVGHDATFAPYAMRGAGGTIVGIDVDFLELVARRTGLQFVHEDRGNWLATLEAFRAREIDLLGSMGTDPEREAYMSYSAAYTLAPNVIITRNDSPYLFDLRDLSGRTVSVPRGYAGLRDDLNVHAPGHQAVEYPTSLDCYRAVSRGEVFASIGDLANAAYLIKTHRLGNLRLGSVTQDSSEIYFGVRKDWPVLLGLIDKVIADLTPVERKGINDRWIALDYRPDGWSAVAFKIAAGVAVLAVGVFLLVFLHNRRLAQELAERRRIQVELERTHRALIASGEEKNHLLNTVAHDLRNPLTGIMLGADFIRTLPGGPAPAIDAAERIRRSVNQMISLINELLTVQRIEAGRLELRFAPADAAAVVRASVQSFGPAAARKNIALVAQLPAAGLPLETDEGVLQQVVDNLISNAVKYSPAGSPVEIELTAGDGRCRLAVRDRGPGVPPEERESIFGQYSRGSARPTAGESSIGLGLWIVRRLVTGLQGTVRCEAAPERGAVFVVDLPLRPGATAV